MTSRWLLALLALALACTPARPKRERPLAPAARAQVGLPGPTTPPPERLRVHVIDVGQGLAVLFEFPCAAVLVDAGGEDSSRFNGTKALMDYLHAFFERRADLNHSLATVFVTHPHLDHTRALPAVMGAFTVKHLVTNGMPKGATGVQFESGGEQQDAAERQMKARGALRTVFREEVQPGVGLTDGHIDAVQCGAVDPKLSVLWGALKENTEAWEPRAFLNANNHSLAIKVSVDGHDVLVPGDLETEALHSLLAEHGAAALNVDVYVVGHHGSHNGVTMDLVKAMTPCVAVIPMGSAAREDDWTAWQYGHPRKVAVQTVHQGLGCSRPRRDVQVALGMRRFEGFTVTHALYGTGWEGTVVLEVNEGGGWRTVTER